MALESLTGRSVAFPSPSRSVAVRDTSEPPWRRLVPSRSMKQFLGQQHKAPWQFWSALSASAPVGSVQRCRAGGRSELIPIGANCDHSLAIPGPPSGRLCGLPGSAVLVIRDAAGKEARTAWPAFPRRFHRRLKKAASIVLFELQQRQLAAGQAADSGSDFELTAKLLADHRSYNLRAYRRRRAPPETQPLNGLCPL